jgi:hypothetical protein
MSCVLRASGSDFSVDRFLEGSELISCTVYLKGEQRSPASKSRGNVNKSSGLRIDVSEAAFDDVQGQIRDAVSFLKRNEAELRRLCKFPGVEGVTLDFGIAMRDVIAQYDYFPPELLYLAGSLGIGIELSQYPVEDWIIQSGARITTACSGRAITESVIFKIQRAPLMPGVMLLCDSVWNELTPMRNILSKISAAKLLRYCLIAVVLLVIGVPVLYAANDYRLKKKYERALNQIQVGDSKQDIVALLGEPDGRYWCYPLPTDHDTPERKKFHEQCVDEYWYVTFLQPYIITFDKDGRVSGKGHMVSPWFCSSGAA